MSHVLRFEDLIQLDFAKQIFFEHKFVDAAVGDEGYLRDGGTLFVTEHRVERSHEAERAIFTVGGWGSMRCFKSNHAADE